jgi:hypothetical protein
MKNSRHHQYFLQTDSVSANTFFILEVGGVTEKNNVPYKNGANFDIFRKNIGDYCMKFAVCVEERGGGKAASA